MFIIIFFSFISDIASSSNVSFDSLKKKLSDSFLPDEPSTDTPDIAGTYFSLFPLYEVIDSYYAFKNKYFIEFVILNHFLQF